MTVIMAIIGIVVFLVLLGLSIYCFRLKCTKVKKEVVIIDGKEIEIDPKKPSSKNLVTPGMKKGK